MYSVLGVMIGAIFVQYASWHWIFWSLTLITIPIALLCIIVVPPSSQSEATSDLQSKVSKFKSLDLLGIGLLTSRRFSYSIGTVINHKNPEQLLSFFLFLLWHLALPMGGGRRRFWPHSLSQYAWLAPSSLGKGCYHLKWLLCMSIVGFAFRYLTSWKPSTHLVLPELFDFVHGCTDAVSLVDDNIYDIQHFVARSLPMDCHFGRSTHVRIAFVCSLIHCLFQSSVRLPIGVVAFAMSFTGAMSRVINPKWIIITGQLLVIIATLLLVFADGVDKYWSFVFPAFTIGSAGAMLCYTHTKYVTFVLVGPE